MPTDSASHKYASYSAEELLQDDYFITSMRYPAEDSEAFWKRTVRNGIIDVREYALACYFIKSVQVCPERMMPGEIFDLWENIEIANKGYLKKRRRRSFFAFSALAGMVALWLLLFTLPLVWNNNASDDTAASHIEDVQMQAELSGTDVQLVLANNETLSLEGKETEIAYRDEEIEITTQGSAMKKKQTLSDETVVYNQLIVPKGKRSMLTFAEGSRIWVNAGTRIVYPAVFDREKREIYVNGEAFLEISRNEACPFLVKTKGFSVEVLGTSFNLTAYEKDTLQSVVLVSGVVTIHSESKPVTTLSPNEMYASVNGSSEVKTVDKIDSYL